MIPTKKNLQNMPVYYPGKPLEEVQKELGLCSVIKMASNENPYGCSDHVLEAITKDGVFFSMYPESTSPAVIEKIAAHLDIDEGRLLIGNGSDEIVQLIASAYLEKGTESVMADRTFPRYNMVTQMEGARSIEIPLREGFHHLDEMQKAISDRTRVVWICNPNNPTGTIVSGEKIRSFIDQLPDHVLVVMDEAYAEYVSDSEYPDSVELLNHNSQVIILRTFSKIYGLAAFRIGYAIGHPEIIRELHRVRSPFNVNRLAQQAAIASIADQAFITYCHNQNRIGMKQITEKLTEWGIPYYPSHGNFILMDIGISGDEVSSSLLSKGIIVRSGTALGFPTHIRVTIGRGEQNEKFLAELQSFLKRWVPVDM